MNKLLNITLKRSQKILHYRGVSKILVYYI